MQQKLILNPQFALEQELKLELAASVNPEVEDHWSQKIRAGLIPTEVLQSGGFNFYSHVQKLQALAQFECEQATSIMMAIRKQCYRQAGLNIHYGGIGTGFGLRLVTGVANHLGLGVITFDTSSWGVNNGTDAIQRHSSNYHIARTAERNRVYQADIEFICGERYMPRRSARLLILPRILDVLNNVSKDPEKMQRTARKIGRMLGYLKVLVIHPEPEGNEQAIFRDTTVTPLETVRDHMAEGLESEVELARLGTHNFHGHIYTAALLHKK